MNKDRKDHHDQADAEISELLHLLAVNEQAEPDHRDYETGRRAVAIDDSLTPGQAARRRRGARLIQRVFEVDPLTWARGGGRMKVIGFIESCQREVIDLILHHLGLDPQPRPPLDPRAPPPGPGAGGPRPVRERDRAERVPELRSVPDLDHRPDLAPDDGPSVDLEVEARDPEGRDPEF